MGAPVRKIAALMLVMSLLGGCATVESGKSFDETRMSEIRKGKTTKQDIIAMFGSPGGTSTDDQGHDILTYQHSTTKGSMSPMAFVPLIGLFFMNTKEESETRTLTVTLKNDVVEKYNFSTNAGGSSLKEL
jgi:outer membrane protein assembly factor BamE (lipoprotein component of BamABCDE complex)